MLTLIIALQVYDANSHKFSILLPLLLIAVLNNLKSTHNDIKTINLTAWLFEICHLSYYTGLPMELTLQHNACAFQSWILIHLMSVSRYIQLEQNICDINIIKYI